MKCNFACHLNFTVMRDILLDHNATGHMELLRQVVVFSQISARIIPTHLKPFLFPVGCSPKSRTDPTQPINNSEMDHFYMSLFHYQYTLPGHPWTRKIQLLTVEQHSWQPEIQMDSIGRGHKTLGAGISEIKREF